MAASVLSTRLNQAIKIPYVSLATGGARHRTCCATLTKRFATSTAAADLKWLVSLPPLLFQPCVVLLCLPKFPGTRLKTVRLRRARVQLPADPRTHHSAAPKKKTQKEMFKATFLLSALILVTSFVDGTVPSRVSCCYHELFGLVELPCFRLIFRFYFEF